MVYNLFIFKYLFLFIHIYVYVCVGAYRNQKEASAFLEVEL